MRKVLCAETCQHKSDTDVVLDARVDVVYGQRMFKHVNASSIKAQLSLQSFFFQPCQPWSRHDCSDRDRRKSRRTNACKAMQTSSTGTTLPPQGTRRGSSGNQVGESREPSGGESPLSRAGQRECYVEPASPNFLPASPNFLDSPTTPPTLLPTPS